ncbi:MAG: hypothetical protein CM1200mP40_16840 [Gammaproteobacteria bacterium]|nr:MAG: hypothetical protein CM1200mP40_16840 [Gammaproteobacteria bacterium]
MYVSNGWSVVYALDAVTGEEIWTYDPEVDRSYIRLACCGPAHNRGVAVYEGKVFVGTFDGGLVAIDATTGEEVWDVDTWIPADLADLILPVHPERLGENFISVKVAAKPDIVVVM